MRIHRTWLVAITLVGSLACGDKSDSAKTRVPRRFVALGAPLLNLSESDSLLATDVRDALLVGGRIVTLQPDDARVRAIDAQTGVVSWMFGVRGAGPGEFAAPSSMFVRENGGVAIIDPRQGRLTLLTASGELESNLSGAFTAHEVHNGCDTHGVGTLGIHVPAQELVRSNVNGAVTARRALIWPDPRQHQHIVFQQGLFARSRDGQCVLYSVRGNYFATIDPVTLMPGPFHKYIEGFDFPPIEIKNGQPMVTDSRVAATFAALHASRLYVLAGGGGKMDSRIVDVYRHADGSYEYSFELPRSAYEIDVEDGLLLVLEWPDTGTRLAVYPLPRGPNGE